MKNDTPQYQVTLTPEELADKSLSLEAKIILKIVEAELAATGKYFTNRLTNKTLARMTALSESTIKRKIDELSQKKRIGIVHDNHMSKTDPQTWNVTRISDIRSIYLDRKKAAYRQREITKDKRPRNDDFNFYRYEFGWNYKQYCAARKEWQKEEQDQKETERKAASKRHYENWLMELTVEALAVQEKLDKVEQGTYIKMKQDYLKQLEEYRNEPDQLFDD